MQQIRLLSRHHLVKSRVVRRHVHQFVSHTFEVASRTELPHSQRDVTQEDDRRTLTETIHASSRLSDRNVGGQGTFVCLHICACNQTKSERLKYSNGSRHSEGI